jgi:hypothetical protein
MAKFQRQFKTGAEYSVEGSSKKKRRLKFVGAAQISGEEYLLFRPVRRAKKQA